MHALAACVALLASPSNVSILVSFIAVVRDDDGRASPPSSFPLLPLCPPLAPPTPPLTHAHAPSPSYHTQQLAPGLAWRWPVERLRLESKRTRLEPSQEVMERLCLAPSSSLSSLFLLSAFPPPASLLPAASRKAKERRMRERRGMEGGKDRAFL